MVYLLIIGILLVGVAGFMLLLRGKSGKLGIKEPEIKKEEKPFVFSNDKQYVFSRKIKKQEPPGSEIKRAEIKNPPANKASAPVAPKIVNPEIKPGKTKKETPPSKTGMHFADSSEKPKKHPKKNDIDFDHLSELIEDFFDEGTNFKNRS